jgi:hypothetical protein
MTYDLATLTRPERVRNIVDPPMMPDAMLRRPRHPRGSRVCAKCKTRTTDCVQRLNGTWLCARCAHEIEYYNRAALRRRQKIDAMMAGATT